MNESYSLNPNLETISNANGMSVTTMAWAATIISMKGPVKGEDASDVFLGLKAHAD